MANIKDIAKSAGVSVSTVSRVLNNHPYVSDKLRAKVEAAIETFQYASNSNAIKLSTGKTNIIGVVVPVVNHICYDTIIQGILESAQEHGYCVMILSSNYMVTKEYEFLEMLRRKEIDGIIFISKACDDAYLEKYSKYGAIANCKRNHINGIHNIYPKRLESYYEIFNKLKNANCEIIYVLTEIDKTLSQSTREKEQAYTEVIKRPTNQYFVNGIKRSQEAKEFASKIFGNIKNTTSFGFYVDSDEVALSILFESQKYGISYKDNLFIFSEGNTILSKLFDIASVDYHLFTVGTFLFESLFSEVNTSLALDYSL